MQQLFQLYLMYFRSTISKTPSKENIAAPLRLVAEKVHTRRIIFLRNLQETVFKANKENFDVISFWGICAAFHQLPIVVQVLGKRWERQLVVKMLKLPVFLPVLFLIKRRYYNPDVNSGGADSNGPDVRDPEFFFLKKSESYVDLMHPPDIT